MYFCLQEHSSFSNASIATHFLHPRSHLLGCFPRSIRLSSHLLSTHPAFLSPNIHCACNYLFSASPSSQRMFTVSLSVERSTGYVVDAQQKRTAWLQHHQVSEISCNLTQSQALQSVLVSIQLYSVVPVFVLHKLINLWWEKTRSSFYMPYLLAGCQRY